MNFDHWFEREGAAMVASGCSAATLALAAWQACKGECLRVVESRLGPPLARGEMEYLVIESLRDELDAAI